MKSAALAFLLVPAIALAAPSIKRQDLEAATDELLFSVTLPTFISRRAALDPPGLDWSSDSCSSSPDNPFGFPFDPACQRHDFGYRNYKAQNRFTDSGKLSIDNNFKDDLYDQCAGESAQGACESLADVYYAAVRAFGREAAEGVEATSASEEDVKEYNARVTVYKYKVAEAQGKGELPALE